MNDRRIAFVWDEISILKNRSLAKTFYCLTQWGLPARNFTNRATRFSESIFAGVIWCR
uniref:Uncharacterized protein n=1 Tax=Anguilla anguilla TaxID=7936 RepID=A0A0E9Y0X9_ANGAN